jgi:hypothetical protein
VGLQDGVADYEAGVKELEGAESAEPAAAIEKARAAQQRFRDARASALSAVVKALEAARTQGASAKSLAPSEHAAAVEADRLAEAALGDKKIAAGVGAIEAWRKASAAAKATGERQYDERLAALKGRRESALARVLGEEAALEAGDAAGRRAAAAREQGDYATAIAALAEAEDHFVRADASCPVKASAENIKVNVATATKLEFGEGFEMVCGTAKGFVVSTGTQLQCRAPVGPDFPLVAKGEAQKPVKALVAGGADTVFAAVFDASGASIHRLRVGNAIELDKVVVEKVGGFVSALGYDRISHLVYAATNKDRSITVFSEETGKVARPLIDLGRTAIHLPRSIAVLRDGRVVVCGQRNDGNKDEKDWTFAMAAFAFDEKAGAWSLDGAELADKAPSAIAAAGDGVVGVEHSDDGRVLAWPKAAVASEPQAILVPPAVPVLKPKRALRLSIYGKYAYLLDIGIDDKPGSLLRRRVLVYKLDR